MGRKLDIPSASELIEKYAKNGCTISSLAREYKTSTLTIRKWLDIHNIERKSQQEASTQSNTKSLTPECPDLQKLIDLIKSGQSISAIKSHFNTTTSQVNMWLKLNGLVAQSNKYMKKDIPSKETLGESLENMTYQDMCSYYNVSYPTMMKWLTMHGLVRSKEHTNKLMNVSMTTKKLELYGYPHFPESVYNTTGTSKTETELKDYLNSLGNFNFKKTHIFYKNGDRRELDMFDADKRIAVEYSGAFWHSEYNQPNKKYHYDKWKYCSDNGIKLITIWDIEYKERKTQIQNFIKANLGVFDERIYARNTTFREISSKQYDFFDDNHIQGRTNIDRNFGLFDSNDRLVGCVSYASHHRDNSKYVLNRLAFLANVQVIGGVGKLLKTSLKLLERDVITWSDNRFSTGQIYENNGFSFDSNLPVDYSYVDVKKCKLLSKQTQQKKKIGCPPDITEHEFCKTLGRYRLWDCGKKRFVYKHK